MSTAVTCRGCGMGVARSAKVCWICHCPHPTCHLNEDADTNEEILTALPADPVDHGGISWLWAIPTGLSLLLTGLTVAGACILVMNWNFVRAQSVHSINSFLTRPVTR